MIPGEALNISSIGHAAQQLQTPVDIVIQQKNSLGVVTHNINGVAYIDNADLERIRAAIMGQSVLPSMQILPNFNNIT